MFLPNPPLPLPLKSVDPKGTSRATAPRMSKQQKQSFPRDRSCATSTAVSFNCQNVSPKYPKDENSCESERLASDPENESSGHASNSCDDYEEIYEDFSTGNGMGQYSARRLTYFHENLRNNFNDAMEDVGESYFQEEGDACLVLSEC